MDRWIGIGSYGLAALAFGLLTALLLAGLGRSPRGQLLAGAAAGSFAWAAVNALMAWGVLPPAAILVAGAEALRLAVWLVFVAVIARSCAAVTDPGSPRRRTGDRWLLVAGAGLLAAVAGAGLLAVSSRPSVMAFALLLVAVLAGMVMVEQLYRGAAPDNRWGLKHLCLGLGIAMAYDFYLFADALLFGALSPAAWQARGIVNALVVPLLAVSAARNPNWEVSIGVSRGLVTDSVVVLVAGVYLLTMSAAGYYVRLVGGAWGGVLQIAFLVGAVLVVLVGVFSTTVRARTRVFIAKHFFSYKYDYREEWLRFIATLSAGEGGEPLRVRAIRAVAQIVDSRAGLLWTRNDTGNFALVATWNASVPGALTESGQAALIRYMERTGWIVDVDEARRDPSIYDDCELPEWISLLPSAWLIVPMFTPDRMAGFLVLKRSLSDTRLNWEDRDLLKTAGREVAAFVALLDANEALIDARQFDAFNRLSAFVVHDLKNVLAQLSLISRNADRHRDNPAFVDDAFATVRSAEARMQRVLDALGRRPSDQEDAAVHERVSVAGVLREVVRRAGAREPAPLLEAVPDPDPVVEGSEARLTDHLEHLVRNAQEATPAAGEVTLSASVVDDAVLIRVADTGSGMEEQYVRDSLFRPFATTKGNAGMGVGVFQVRQYVEYLGGAVSVWTRPGEGTVFTLRLPLAAEGGAPTAMVGGASVPG